MNTNTARFPDMSIEASQLMTKLANATATYYECSGHNKAARNDIKRAEYREQLEAMNIAIPTDRELCELGVFNGEGSY